MHRGQLVNWLTKFKPRLGKTAKQSIEVTCVHRVRVIEYRMYIIV